MELIELLDALQEKIENGGTVPFSSKVMVDPDEVLDLLDDIRLQMPQEIKEATRIKEDEQRILDSAERRAKNIRLEAEKKMRELIDSDEITRNAYSHANEILKNANQEVLKMRVSTIDYSNSVLKKVQDELLSVMDVIESNKAELKEMRKATINNKVTPDI